jgi:hypothetical protein
MVFELNQAAQGINRKRVQRLMRPATETKTAKNKTAKKPS